MGKVLSPHFVCALLNDLYGIQSRSGCCCAGPYGLDLNDVTDQESEHIFVANEQLNTELFKPGWCRINCGWFESHEDVKFIAEAVLQVGWYGWKLLPQYIIDVQQSLFIHHSIADGGQLERARQQGHLLITD